MTQRQAHYRTSSSEHEQQAAVITWAKTHEARYPELRLLFAVPNAAKRSFKLAAWMKAEGMKKGVPDLWLPVARLDWHGMVIEQKWTGGEVSDEQECWLEMLSAAGWFTLVSWSAGETITALETYLNFEREP